MVLENKQLGVKIVRILTPNLFFCHEICIFAP